MAEEIDRSPFIIASYTEGNPPIGISPTRPVTQGVYVDAPVHRWTARKVGEDTYHLSVLGYPFVGVSNGRVIASIHPEVAKVWKITRHKFQGAYTIELADKPGYGWTIPSGEEQRRDIVIGIIKVLLSEPPQFVPGQLFFLKHEE